MSGFRVPNTVEKLASDILLCSREEMRLQAELELYKKLVGQRLAWFDSEIAAFQQHRKKCGECPLATKLLPLERTE